MGLIKTVKVKVLKNGSVCTINESDFTPELHALITAGQPPAKPDESSVAARKKAAAEAEAKAKADAEAKAAGDKKKG